MIHFVCDNQSFPRQNYFPFKLNINLLFALFSCVREGEMERWNDGEMEDVLCYFIFGFSFTLHVHPERIVSRLHYFQRERIHCT